jgi:hypothetical protein
MFQWAFRLWEGPVFPHLLEGLRRQAREIACSKTLPPTTMHHLSQGPVDGVGCLGRAEHLLSFMKQFGIEIECCVLPHRTIISIR